jgi:branched-chain amino acid transport system permease protein
MRVLSLSPKRALLLEWLFWIVFASSFIWAPGKLPLLTQVLIYGLFAVSLDMALGYAGILTVGHAAFFGTGAYVAGIVAAHGWGEPFSGIIIAMLICAALGYASSYLIVRGTDLARLMISIGICLLLGDLANRLGDITGGTDGLQGITIWPIFGVFSFDLYGRVGFLYAFAIVLVTFLVVRIILRSPFGLVLQGIHNNRKRMQAIGSPVDARLRMAYCQSAVVAGIAGALLAQTTQFVGIGTLSFDRSAEILIILVLGGTGRLYGGMIGAIVYMLLHNWFANLSPEYWMFWLGIFLVAVVMLGRGGILGWFSRWVRVNP